MNDFIKSEMQEFVNDFLIESKELIENIDNDIISLEKEPDDDNCLNNIFRAIHTIKGTSSFMGLEKITNFSHELESVLNLLRNKQITLNDQIMDIVLESIDLIKVLLQDVENGFCSDIDTSLCKVKLTEIINNDSSNYNKSNMADSQKNTDQAAENNLENKKDGIDIKSNAQEYKKIGEILVEEKHISKEDVDDALYKQALDPKIGEILVDEGKISENTLKKALQKQKKPETQPESTMRVEVKRLDDLMNNVSELVLARNRLMQISKYFENLLENNNITVKLSELANNFDILTSDMHASLMKVRMIPINKLFNKFPRMVRDLAKNTNKEIELAVFGDDTELDKSIVEELNDPMLHLIRNAVDHGIESPQERISKGKPAKGTITISAYQKSNSIIIDVKDDGKGIDAKKVLEKALEKKIISQEEAKSATNSKIYQLIFAPGFSTAKKVSDISGRGVGMDVVKTNIEKLRGTISTSSELDKGTTISLKIPVTLEIMQALIVESYDQSFAVPLTSITNVLSLNEDDIETIREKEVLHMKDYVLSLVRLENIFNIDVSEKKKKEFVIILDSSESKIGLIVTGIIGKEEIVIKTLDSHICNSRYISGATILGNGLVSLVIDVAELLKFVLEKDI
ncbi:MAG: chemotaxis protein CheA [Actinomycetota bacterium]|nr:chemotaxis protein CheA [Actinomycetota bacterium]